MATDLSQFLRSSAGRASLSPEKLELMGKEAAALFMEKSLPLEEGVVKLASQYPDMNAEQVRRVVEFANTQAYLSLHEKNKTAGADSSYPQFRLADPETVLAKLGAAARQDPFTIHDTSYSTAPEKQKLSNAKRDGELAALFGYDEGKTKTAGAITDESAAHNLLSAKSDLKDLKDTLESSGEMIQMIRKQAEADYYDAMKHHILGGGSVVDILRGAAETELHGTKIASVLTPFLSRLQAEKVCPKTAFTKEAMAIGELRHRQVDPEHPFVAGFAAVSRLADEENKVAEALQDIDTQITKVDHEIREAFVRAG